MFLLKVFSVDYTRMLSASCNITLYGFRVTSGLIFWYVTPKPCDIHVCIMLTFQIVMLNCHLFISTCQKNTITASTLMNYYTIILLAFRWGQPRRWRSGLERSPLKRKVGCSNPSFNRPKSLKQVVTAPLTNTRHSVWVSRVLTDDHYIRMTRFTLGVAR